MIEEDYEDADREEASFDELRSIQVTRNQLEAWYDKPFFSGQGMHGLVVRAAYSGGYMLMTIRDIKDLTKQYPFGPRNAPCTRYLELVDGLDIPHTLPMQVISNQVLEEAELERYQRHCARAKRKPLSKEDVEVARGKIQEALSYRWDSSKVREVLEAKRASGRLPVNIAAEKARLRRLLEGAEGKDPEEAAELERQLRDLEAQALVEKPGSSRTYGMSHINKRNMQINFNIAFKNVSNKPAGAAERKGGADPFSRRATRPNIYWNTGGPQTATQVAKVPETDAKKAAQAARAQPTKLAASLQALDPQDLIRLLDIDIDTRPLQEFNIAPPLARKLLGPQWEASLGRDQAALNLSNKGVLTVADWKRRAGYM